MLMAKNGQKVSKSDDIAYSAFNKQVYGLLVQKRLQVKTAVTSVSDLDYSDYSDCRNTALKQLHVKNTVGGKEARRGSEASWKNDSHKIKTKPRKKTRLARPKQ